MFTASWDGTYRSADNGDNWTKVSDTPSARYAFNAALRPLIRARNEERIRFARR